MGLQSAMATALTGMTAAETTIDVAGNNVANANTVGFKESSVNFATQFLQTQSIGSAPTQNRGGTNPRQIGLGAKVAEITPDFTQGTVEISSNPLDLAIQGDGFFIVQGPQGEQFYTRNGQFKTNANNEIVTLTGHRVLGYSVDANFTIQPTGLSPIQIPLGAAAVAQATENVILKGALNADGVIGTIPEVIQSGVLSDGSREVPSGVPDVLSLARPGDTVQFGSPPSVPGATFPPGVYNYRVVYVESSGNEGPASTIADTAVGAGGAASINLSVIPQPADPVAFPNIRIYRNDPASGTEYLRVAEIPAGTTTYPDNTAWATLTGDPVTHPELNDGSLSNNSYKYYVTFYNSSTGAESRPTAQIGPVTADAINQPRIRLDDIPQPTAGGEYDRIKIYRNVATNTTQFFEVAEILPGVDFIDSVPDADIIGNATVNLDGPPINFGLALVDVVSRNNADYNNLFSEGVLTFSGDKGGRQLGERSLTITSTTTVQDLLTFMDESMGVLKTAPEATFPGTVAYGGDIVDSRLQFTSNMGIENALSIDLSAFTFTPARETEAEVLQIPFASVQEANGEGATADFVVYDSLGTPLNVRVTTVLESRDETGTRFRWIATSPQNVPDSGYSIEVGSGVITTDGNGKFVSATSDRIAIGRGATPANSPLEFQLDFDQVTGLASDHDSLSAASQDGFPAGTLTSFIITESGRIQGVFSNGSSRDLGQLRMARFANNGGLQQVGDNMFTAGVNSGLPIEDNPGDGGMGAVTTGAVELSNTDIGQNLIELILASTQYRGGARVITAVQQLLDELMSLRR